jgi:hypothetical protein
VKKVKVHGIDRERKAGCVLAIKGVWFEQVMMVRGMEEV